MDEHVVNTQPKDDHLVVELAQREAELTILNSVQQALSSNLEVQAIYDLVGEKIREIFDAQIVMISMYDLNTDTVEHRYMIECGRRVFYPGPHPPGGFRSKIIQSRQPLMINADVEREALRLNQPVIPGTLTPKSWLGVPMIVGNRVTGVLSLQNISRENVFRKSDVRLLQTIASSMSVALENARLFDQTQQLLVESNRRAAELEIINQVQSQLANKLDKQSIYELVGQEICKILCEKTHVVFIGIQDISRNVIEYPFISFSKKNNFDTEMDPGEIISSKHFNLNQALLVKNTSEFDGLSISPASINSAILVPLKTSIGIQGVLGAVNNEVDNIFTNADMRLMETLSGAMGVALENAHFWEQEYLYRKALEREFEVGREIQAGFLPYILPQPIGWEIAASLKPAREVAGDFYDLYEMPGDKIGLVIADVCDKGLGAALFMTLFRSLLRVLTRMDMYSGNSENNGNEIAQSLRNAIFTTNNYISDTHGDTGMFATIFFGILDKKSGLLTYINGGHLPPLIISANGERESLSITGPAVGVIQNIDFRPNEIFINKGDTIFAYTDGLIDSENITGERFGEDRLLAILKGSEPLCSLLNNIQDQVAAFSGGAKQFDDITMLGLRRNPE